MAEKERESQKQAVRER